MTGNSIQHNDSSVEHFVVKFVGIHLLQFYDIFYCISISLRASSLITSLCLFFPLHTRPLALCLPLVGCVWVYVCKENSVVLCTCDGIYIYINNKMLCYSLAVSIPSSSSNMIMEEILSIVELSMPPNYSKEQEGQDKWNKLSFF